MWKTKSVLLVRKTLPTRQRLSASIPQSNTSVVYKEFTPQQTQHHIHKKIVISDTVHRSTYDKLQKFSKWIFEKFYYGFNPAIQTTFHMINKIIDSWYSAQ